MAKGVRDYKAEYERRIARAIEKGKTRQQARGHRPQEHIIRREREIEAFGLSTSNMRSITTWINRRNAEIHDASLDPEDAIDQARELGYEWFTSYRDRWNALRRNYKREQRNGTWASRGLAFLEGIAAEVAVDDISWLYYH